MAGFGCDKRPCHHPVMRIVIDGTPEEFQRFTLTRSLLQRQEANESDGEMAEPNLTSWSEVWDEDVQKFVTDRLGSYPRKFKGAVDFLEGLVERIGPVRGVPSEKKGSPDGFGNRLRLYSPDVSHSAFATLSLRSGRVYLRLQTGMTELKHAYELENTGKNWSVAMKGVYAGREQMEEAWNLCKLAVDNLNNPTWVWWSVPEAQASNQGNATPTAS